jgi:tRNA(fMet)-specific endonuclease VapC
MTAEQNQAGVSLPYTDNQTTRHYAALYRQLRQQGTPIPTNDMWIAALVLQHSLALFARDTHFDVLPQLMRVREAKTPRVFWVFQ